MTKLTAEFQVAKKGIDARLAKVDKERAEDAKLVDAESKQLSERVAQQERQVTPRSLRDEPMASSHPVVACQDWQHPAVPDSAMERQCLKFL